MLVFYWCTYKLCCFVKLKDHCHLVWLLFFDLYKRDFTVRDAMEPTVAAAWTRQGLHEIDEVLWQLRVKLAATVSRLRIKSGAHSLSELLPPHLRHTRSALEENIITGWVNVFKARYFLYLLGHHGVKDYSFLFL